MKLVRLSWLLLGLSIGIMIGVLIGVLIAADVFSPNLLDPIQNGGYWL